MLSSGRFMVLCCESSDQITLGTRYGLWTFQDGRRLGRESKKPAFTPCQCPVLYVLLLGKDILGRISLAPRCYITRLVRRCFCAKELCAHVVVDPNNMRPLFCEPLYGFRTNQSCGASDDNCAHLVDDNH